MAELFDDNLFDDIDNTEKKLIVTDGVLQTEKISPVSPVLSTADEKTSEKIDEEKSDFKDPDVDLPYLLGPKSEYDPAYLNIVERILESYKRLPILNYSDLYSEIKCLAVKSEPVPTLQVLNKQLENVQGAKDRLGEIIFDIIECYNIKKRAVDLLRDAWGRFTSVKNAEGRKGDAAYRVGIFEMDLAEVEALMKGCLHVLKNLDSFQEVLSRKITILQMQLKLYDLGRGSLPDFDFDKNALMTNDDELWTGNQKKSVDAKAAIEAEEQSF